MYNGGPETPGTPKEEAVAVAKGLAFGLAFPLLIIVIMLITH